MIRVSNLKANDIINERFSSRRPSSRTVSSWRTYKRCAPLAQLVRASVLSTEGREFEPLREHLCHFEILYYIIFIRENEVLDRVWDTQMNNFSSDDDCLSIYTSVLRDLQTVPEGLYLDSNQDTLETMRSRERRFFDWVASEELKIAGK